MLADDESVHVYTTGCILVAFSSTLFLLLLLLLLLLSLSLSETVDGGERAVLFDRLRGVLPNVCGEGLNFIVPVLQVRKASKWRGSALTSILRYTCSRSFIVRVTD